MLSSNYTYKNIGKKLRTLSNSIQKVSNPIIVSWSLKQSEYSFNPSNICGCQERYGIVCNFPSEKFVQLLHVHCVLLFLPLKPFSVRRFFCSSKHTTAPTNPIKKLKGFFSLLNIKYICVCLYFAGKGSLQCHSKLYSCMKQQKHVFRANIFLHQAKKSRFSPLSKSMKA